MRILIATGGTAGHILPARYTAAEFRKAGHEVIFAGVFRDQQKTIEGEGFRVIELPARGFALGNPWVAWHSLSAMARAIVLSWKMIPELKPDVVLGFGGYGAFAVVLAASWKGVPTIIHEQNVHPGKANKILSFFVKKIAVSFQESNKYFPEFRIALTGYPCREVRAVYNREEILKRFNLVPGKFTILVVGGSQGSHQINKVFLDTIGLVKKQMDFQVIHSCGDKDFSELQTRCQGSGVPYFLTPFLSNMDEGYSVADLVISRAGAGTVTELAAFGVPAILVPYPFAGGHQRDNAGVLSQRGVAIILEEKFLNPENLSGAILAVRPINRKEIFTRLQGVYRPDAARRLSQETLNLVKT